MGALVSKGKKRELDTGEAAAAELRSRLSSGAVTPLPDLSALASGVERVLSAGDADPAAYLAARDGGGTLSPLWNLDAAGFPSAVAVCASAEQVAHAVSYARTCLPGDSPHRVAVACGRHSTKCLVDNALVVDVSRLKGVAVDSGARTATVGGGATQGELDDACEPHGLAVTAGHVRSTGCGGLIPQGGHGTLEKLVGLAVDSLLEVEIVLADGRIVTASETEERDLFWAVRGAGANFGIVTRFKLRLHEIPREVLRVQRVHLPLGVWRMRDRPDIARDFLALTDAEGRDEVSGFLILPAGGPVIEVIAHFGDVERAREELAEHRKTAGYPVRDSAKVVSYWRDMQRMAPDNRGHFYMSALVVSAPHESAFHDALGEAASRANAPGGGVAASIVCVPTCGAVQRVAPEETAYANRTGRFWVLLSAEWDGSAAGREIAAAWVKSVKERLAPHASGAYAVLSDARDSEEQARSVYGVNLPRLRALKKRYDPSNMFRLNDNILPAEE